MKRIWLVMALISGGCGGDDSGADAGHTAQSCATDDRAPAFELGMSETGEAGYTATITEASPMPAARDDNDWTMTITDPQGASAEGLAVAIDPQMPDHGHGTPIEATVIEPSPGTYEITRINLWMPGYWEVGVTLQDTGGTTVDTLTFRVCIDP